MVFENEFEDISDLILSDMSPVKSKISLVYKLSKIFIDVGNEEYFDKLVRDAKVLSKGLCPKSSFDHKILTHLEYKEKLKSLYSLGLDLNKLSESVKKI